MVYMNNKGGRTLVLLNGIEINVNGAKAPSPVLAGLKSQGE